MFFVDSLKKIISVDSENKCCGFFEHEFCGFPLANLCLYMFVLAPEHDVVGLCLRQTRVVSSLFPCHYVARSKKCFKQSFSNTTEDGVGVLNVKVIFQEIKRDILIFYQIPGSIIDFVILVRNKLCHILAL